MPRAHGGPARCCPRPASGVSNHRRLVPRRHQQRVQERERHGDGERKERNDGAGAPQRLDARRLVLVRAARQRVAAAEQRERQREGDERGDRQVGQPTSPTRRAPAVAARHEHIERDMVADDGDRRPTPRCRRGCPPRPTRRARPGATGRSCPMRARSHRTPSSDDRQHAGDLLGGQASRGRPAGDRRHDEVCDMMADEHAGERREHQPLDEHGGGGRAGAARGPNACSARPMSPPGMNSAQLSMSAARASTLSTPAASTTHGAQSPASARARPTTKKAPTPSSAMASAAAFQTDMNDSSAVAERTTRTTCRPGRIWWTRGHRPAMIVQRVGGA